MTWYHEALYFPSHKRNKFSLANQLTLDKHVFKTKLQLPQSYFQCNRYVTTSKSLLQVNVDSVTGRDDSLMDSLDFCYTKYLFFSVKVKCPLIFSLMRDLLKKSLNVLRMCIVVRSFAKPYLNWSKGPLTVVIN